MSPRVRVTGPNPEAAQSAEAVLNHILAPHLSRIEHAALHAYLTAPDPETLHREINRVAEGVALPPYEVTQVQTWARPFTDEERTELDRIFGTRITLTVPPGHVPDTVEPMGPADLVLDRDVRK